MKLSKYKKATWTAQKKQKKKMNKKKRNHVSTARVIDEARQKTANNA
jgi:hypothetical protein